MSNTPEIDSDCALPIFIGTNYGARLYTRIGHEDSDWTKLGADGPFKLSDGVEVDHISGKRKCFAYAMKRAKRGVEPSARQIHQHYLFAAGRKTVSRRKADTRCPARNDSQRPCLRGIWQSHGALRFGALEVTVIQILFLS